MASKTKTAAPAAEMLLKNHGIKLAELPVITPEQFHTAVENGKRYTVIEGVVYDIEKFFERHPGGKRLFSLAVGTDATANFYCYHPPQVDRLLGSAKIPAVGEFAGKMPTAATFTWWFKELREECWAKLRAIPGFTKQGTKTQEFYCKGFLQKFLLRLGLLYFAAVMQSMVLGVVAAYMLGALGYKGQFALISHGGSHKCISPNQFVNDALMHYAIPLGVRATEFFTAAHHLHHAFTRVKGLDQQISTDFPHWIVRLSSFTDTTVLTRNQKKLAAVLLFAKLFIIDVFHDSICCIYAFFMRDWAPGFSQFICLAPVQPRLGKSKLTGGDKVIGEYSDIYGATMGEGLAYVSLFTISTLLSPNLFFFWPLAFGVKKGLALCFFSNLVNWWRVYKQSADGTVDPIAFSMHLNARLETPSLKLYGHSDMITVEEHQAHDWGLQQTINSGNLYGIEPHEEVGAAWQIEHHLFPGLSGEWYPHITPIIQRMAEDYTMPDGTKLDYQSLWYTVERESEVAAKLIEEYAHPMAGQKLVKANRTGTAYAFNKQGLARDMGFE